MFTPATMSLKSMLIRFFRIVPFISELGFTGKRYLIMSFRSINTLKMIILI